MSNQSNNIVLKHVTKKFGKTYAVRDLNLEIPANSFISLLGPSGCGKTTTLRMIAGLETPTEGEIWIGDKLVFSAKEGIDVPASNRGIGFLFQNYALWPHMTVYQNIAFGLETLKWKKSAIQARVQEMCELLQLSEYIQRYPSELSGGQQQRVAIARTLATNPSILLMDEPLSNLDAKLRLDMRAELKRLHSTTKATFVYVTHDQMEAMALSTSICLMKMAVLQQYAPPLSLYGEPVNKFVAGFVGNPSINFVDFDHEQMQGDSVLSREGVSFAAKVSVNKANGRILSKKVCVGIRPEDIHIDNTSPLKGEVISAFPYGMETTVMIRFLGADMRSVVFGSVDFTPGQQVGVSINGSNICFFDPETEALEAIGSMELRQ
ncbi:MAG TPA: ABC transporter ATP-binding protein [Candidatus Faecousia faecavium]|nr:ABC transporter ATP-binding protein [Candidatus Faecousia faecavium]